MVIENMTVRNASNEITEIGKRFEPLYYGICERNEKVMAGKAPWFTGLKGWIIEYPNAFHGLAEDEIISGTVKFCGQWIWYHPRRKYDSGLMSIYVNVPPSIIRPDLAAKGKINPVSYTEGGFLPGEPFQIGENFIDPGDDLESVRETILAGKKRIYELAEKDGYIKKAVA